MKCFNTTMRCVFFCLFQMYGDYEESLTMDSVGENEDDDNVSSVNHVSNSLLISTKK